jgi:hypothetical protein
LSVSSPSHTVRVANADERWNSPSLGTHVESSADENRRER